MEMSNDSSDSLSQPMAIVDKKEEFWVSYSRSVPAGPVRVLWINCNSDRQKIWRRLARALGLPWQSVEIACLPAVDNLVNKPPPPPSPYASTDAKLQDDGQDGRLPPINKLVPDLPRRP